MNSFFIYDTAYCKNEEDDPTSAVIYFFPAQAADSQRYLLCCQLAGAAKFLRSTFSVPSVIGLYKGKFAILWSGRYLLGLGGSSDIHNNVLRDRLTFLCGIFCFYHGSINNLLKASNGDREGFLTLMDLAWSRYISFSQCFSNVLQLTLSAMPLKAFKKDAGMITKSTRLLHMCQLSSAVVAGVVYYNNRVLASQLTPELTNFLALMSNANASVPVSNASHTLQTLPPDVELKHIYLSRKVFSYILKLNHAFNGTRVRVKSNSSSSKRKSSTHRESTNSGSDADIDSGNCSESISSDGNKTSQKVLKNCSCKLKNNRACCVTHVRMSERKAALSHNVGLRIPPKYSLDKSLDSEMSTLRSFGESSLIVGSHIPCHHHAHLQASSFVSMSTIKCTNLRSSSDSEFSCLFCSPICSFKFHPLALKRYNSSVDIPCHYESKVCFRCSKKSSAGSGSLHVQVLRCQSRNASPRLKLFMQKSGSRKRNSESESPEKRVCENVEANELQKHEIYVQRYGRSTLLLLLSQQFDEKMINYLWTCGFTGMSDIEDEEQSVDQFNMEPSFYVLQYNYMQKILKEYPNCSSLLLCEKYASRNMQSIQEDFQNDNNLQSVSVVSNSHSIFATHKDQSHFFYLQTEQNSRDPESLCNLSKKAIRRLEKYFKLDSLL